MWKWINHHVTSVGQKKKIWVPDRIRTYDLTKHWASALSTWATEEFMESEAIY